LQREIFQHVGCFAAGERLTTEATGYLAPDGLQPSRNLDNVVKRLAPRTVEERPIVHNPTPTGFVFRMAARNGGFRSSGLAFGAPIVFCNWCRVQPPNQGIVGEGEASLDAARRRPHKRCKLLLVPMASASRRDFSARPRGRRNVAADAHHRVAKLKLRRPPLGSAVNLRNFWSTRTGVGATRQLPNACSLAPS
jgi:hypothetical protein